MKPSSTDINFYWGWPGESPQIYEYPKYIVYHPSQEEKMMKMLIKESLFYNASETMPKLDFPDDIVRLT